MLASDAGDDGMTEPVVEIVVAVAVDLSQPLPFGYSYFVDLPFQVAPDVGPVFVTGAAVHVASLPPIIAPVFLEGFSNMLP